MKQLTAIVHRGEPEEGGFWATCLEVPGANGQGETKAECLDNLKEAIQLLLETERAEVFRLDPQAEAEELVLT
jgi:predicted RNase H-like HicB family nuclease